MILASILRNVSRSLRRHPAVLAFAVLTLALGIGSTTAVFAIVDAMLIRPLPYPNADRLFDVWTEIAPGRRIPGLSGPMLRELLAHRGNLDAIEAYQFGAATLTGEGEPTIVSGPSLSPGLLEKLGVVPRLGRIFVEGDGAGDAVALISESLWTTRFGRADDVIGKRIFVDDTPHSIVGVLPASFAFPERHVAVWKPLDLRTLPASAGRPHTVVFVRPGGTPESAAEELRVLSDRLRSAGLLEQGRILVPLEPLQARFGRRYATALKVMLAAIGFVLLVASVNVANLLLARTAARKSEFAIAAAIGASRAHLVAQVFLESLALAVLAGAGGVFIARGVVSALFELLPPDLTMLAPATGLTWRGVTFAVALSSVTCLLTCLLPAARLTRVNLLDGLKAGAGAVGGASDRWQAGLVVAQLAVVVVLLAGTGLLLTSFLRLVAVSPGVATEGVVVVDLQLPDDRYTTPGGSLTLVEELDRMIEEAPEVNAATFAAGVPPNGGGFFVDVRPEVEGIPQTDVAPLMLPHSAVAPDYFTTLRIPVIEGRSFRADDPDDMVIVNEVVARRYWGGASPLGQRFRVDAGQRWLTVVGVAADVKQMGLDDPMGDGMEVYFPFSRRTRARVFSVAVRAPTADPANTIQRVKERLWALDPHVPVTDAATMEHRLAESVARPRFFLRLSAVFATLTVLLASLGVFGTTAYWVTRRRREMGIRMAVGATPARLVAFVLWRSARLAALGAIAGLLAALWLMRLLQTLLFETVPYEPAVLVAAALALGLLVIVASLVPAARASRVDPVAVLKTE